MKGKRQLTVTQVNEEQERVEAFYPSEDQHDQRENDQNTSAKYIATIRLYLLKLTYDDSD